jgi:hypothetical protein
MGLINRFFGSTKSKSGGSLASNERTPRPPPDDPDDKTPPSPERVLRRARALAALVGRASLEREVIDGDYPVRENEQVRRNVLSWIKDYGLNPELETDEHKFLNTRVGHADEQNVIDAEWRSEGLAVLAWALERCELPRYDKTIGENLSQIMDSVAFLSSAAQADRSEVVRLRPASEIDRFQSHITIVGWRVQQFRISREHPIYQDALAGLGAGRTGVGEAMDFEQYLRAHPNFKEYWFDGLQLIDGDLAIGDTGIADAPREEVKKCSSIATERQIAAYWLQGDNEIYSNVSPATFLSAC